VVTEHSLTNLTRGQSSCGQVNSWTRQLMDWQFTD